MALGEVEGIIEMVIALRGAMVMAGEATGARTGPNPFGAPEVLGAVNADGKACGANVEVVGANPNVVLGLADELGVAITLNAACGALFVLGRGGTATVVVI